MSLAVGGMGQVKGGKDFKLNTAFHLPPPKRSVNPGGPMNYMA